MKQFMESIFAKLRTLLLTLKICLDYSKASNKRTVFNNRTGGDIILQKV